MFEKYYIPAFYYLFSQYDLASICILNEFEFGTQTFSPFHPHWSLKSKFYKNNNIKFDQPKEDQTEADKYYNDTWLPFLNDLSIIGALKRHDGKQSSYPAIALKENKTQKRFYGETTKKQKLIFFKISKI